MASPKAKRPAAEPAGTATGEAQLRVVVVGRTGLDGRLRLDPGVELIRAATPLDAIGELAEALPHDGTLTNVVVVAASSDPSETGDARHSADGGDEEKHPEDPGKRREFLAALRRLDPNVRILRVEGRDGHQPGGSGGEGYDGMLKTDAGADDIRAVLNGRTTPQPPAASMQTAESPAPPAPPPTRIVPPAAPAVEAAEASPLDEAPTGRTAFDNGDETIVRLLLQGRDITDAAIDIAATEAASATHEAPVAWRGRILGRLRSETARTEELVPHASWLAAWIILRDQHAQLREAAFADPLTGAHNRRYFDQFLAMAMDEARKERRGVTLLMFDIDNFKQFNDRYGHAAGDDILRETVRLLRSVIRPSDKVCRIGGDEFAVIFYEPTGPRTPSSRPPSDVCQIAERFQREIAGHKFPKLGREAPGALAISGGLATYPWDGMTPDALLARADELAMQSKRAGKNCIAIGPGAEDAAIDRARSLE